MLRPSPPRMTRGRARAFILLAWKDDVHAAAAEYSCDKSLSLLSGEICRVRVLLSCCTCDTRRRCWRTNERLLPILCCVGGLYSWVPFRCATVRGWTSRGNARGKLTQHRSLLFCRYFQGYFLVGPPLALLAAYSARYQPNQRSPPVARVYR